MNNGTERINKIISELEFLKNNFEHQINSTEFCTNFRLALISKLEQAGAKYDETLEHVWSANGTNTTDKKKFFAFKINDLNSENETLFNLKSVFNRCLEGMQDIGHLQELSFNISKIELLCDRDSFSDLVRGLLVVKEVNNAG